jgi:large subunit ribosomal protein L15
MNLNDLPQQQDSKSRKRKGRGHSSGMGKTCSRGHNGQKSRSGHSLRTTFEGGQMPLARRLPKRGFKALRSRKHDSSVNLADIVSRVHGIDEVTPAVLFEVGLIRKESDTVIILGDGALDTAMTIHAHRFTKSAAQKIEAAGGKTVLL